MTLFTTLSDLDCQQICGGQYTGEPSDPGGDGGVVTTTSTSPTSPTSPTCCAWAMSAPGRRLALRWALGFAFGRRSW